MFKKNLDQLNIGIIASMPIDFFPAVWLFTKYNASVFIYMLD